ncbi:MAG: methionyl-tRNA formyltransferase [bacterium]|nr:methionyl-tRNA formyltransferase [bacterium]
MIFLKIVFMGTPDFAVPILEGLIKNYEVVLVVSQPDKKVGRKQILTPTPVKSKALEYGISVFQPVNIKEDYQRIIDAKPDIIITCAYGQIIPKSLLDYPEYGCINVHASLLPKLRGGAPIHKAIIDDYDKTGITIMYMDVKMDSGDIISQEETKILDSDNLEILHDRLSLMGVELLLKTLPSIFNKTNKRIKQNINEVTFAYNIKREEEHIDFNKTSRQVFNLIRGLNPVPGANFILDNEEFKVYNSRIGTSKNETSGKIINIYKDGIGVSTLDGEIILTEVKPAGKKRMLVRDYLNGIDKNNLLGKVIK